MGDKFKLVLKIEERFNAGNAQRKVFGKIKGRPNKNIEVIHHSGVKGMKWGVRNGPPYPIKNKGKVAKAQSTLKNADGKDIISVNHVELTWKPNSITQIQRKNGGCKGVVLKFNDSNVGVQTLLSDNAVDVAMAASWTVKRKSITPVAPDYSSQVTKIKEDSK